MKYPKKIMTLKELTNTDDPREEYRIGYPREWLMVIYRSRHQEIAWKQNPGASNSPILFDTEELEKYRKKHCTGI